MDLVPPPLSELLGKIFRGITLAVVVALPLLIPVAVVEQAAADTDPDAPYPAEVVPTAYADAEGTRNPTNPPAEVSSSTTPVVAVQECTDSDGDPRDCTYTEEVANCYAAAWDRALQCIESRPQFVDEQAWADLCSWEYLINSGECTIRLIVCILPFIC